MRTALGSAAALGCLLALAGCGDNVSNTGAPPPSTPEPAVIEILSESAAGGEVDPTVTVLTDAEAVDRFVDQFGGSPLAADIGSAFRRHEAGDTLFGAAVISIGCDVPPSATVTEPAESDFVVVPGKVTAPKQECYVPVTSVALVEVPAPAE